MHELHQTTQQSDDGFWISDLAQSALLPEAANVPANFAPAFGFVTQNIPLTGAQDTAYALAVTMNCGATARKDPSARLDCPNSTAASIRAG